MTSYSPLRATTHTHPGDRERQWVCVCKSTGMQTEILTCETGRAASRTAPQGLRLPWAGPSGNFIVLSGHRVWRYQSLCSLPPSLQPPSLHSSASEGDLAYLSVCVSATPGPISDTSCRLCINQMPHKTNSGWSVWNACSVQYVNNHMQIIRPCFSVHANADAYEK